MRMMAGQVGRGRGWHCSLLGLGTLGHKFMSSQGTVGVRAVVGSWALESELYLPLAFGLDLGNVQTLAFLIHLLSLFVPQSTVCLCLNCFTLQINYNSVESHAFLKHLFSWGSGTV